MLYYELHKNSNNDLLVIPDKFMINVNFTVTILELVDNTEIKELSNGLRINQQVLGSVFIHNSAFSPPGCNHFQVNLEKDKNTFLCQITNQNLNINMYVLFVLFNEINKHFDEILSRHNLTEKYNRIRKLLED